MREIKFRAWDSRQKEMFNVDVLVISECTWSCPDHNTRGLSLAYQPNTPVMQFTGLQDRNGVDIYEGDVLEVELHKNRAFSDGKTDNFKLLIEWSRDGFHGRRIGSDTSYSVLFEGGAVVKKEVVGNRFEHPELLEAS